MVYDLANTSIRFCHYWYMIWPIQVDDFANTGIKFANTGEGAFLKNLGRFEVEIEDSKNMGDLRIMPRYGIKNKKKIEFSIAVCVPLNPYLHVRWFLYPLGTVCSRNYPSIKKNCRESSLTMYSYIFLLEATYSYLN